MQLLPRRWSTARLVARAASADDAEATHAAWASLPECTRWLSFPTATSVDESRAFLEMVERAWAGEEGHLSWLLYADDVLIGGIGADVDGPTVTVGYVITPEHWGRGYATEALRELCAISLAEPDLYRVEATCDVENIRSARVLEKVGMQREGHLRRHTIFPNVSKAPRDVWLYAKVSEDP
ncbi:MAG: GNAT family N-acetyltransferase [Myxococcales bacterium]|nr:GNAT family N-acetyltransferase [Myxococcales bacterium]